MAYSCCSVPVSKCRRRLATRRRKNRGVSAAGSAALRIPAIPWAWQCTNAAGNTATVELHFARDVEYGTHLRKAVAANADLMPLGAEHLIDSNRLILRPNEAWVPDPAGRSTSGSRAKSCRVSRRRSSP